MATIQAQGAINKLKAAGLRRSQFSVRTERQDVGQHPDTGKAIYEYGNVQIILRDTNEKLLPYAPAIAEAGLHVEVWQFENFSSLYVTDEYGNSGLWHRDYTNTDEYGLPKTERIN